MIWTSVTRSPASARTASAATMPGASSASARRDSASTQAATHAWILTSAGRQGFLALTQPLSQVSWHSRNLLVMFLGTHTTYLSQVSWHSHNLLYRFLGIHTTWFLTLTYPLIQVSWHSRNLLVRFLSTQATS